jgi:REP element-mobilizing transposase RayT
MARPIRPQYAGAFYHVTDRGDRKEAVFTCDADRISFLELLNTTAARYHWHVLAYCLMENHYHLVLEVVAPNLSAGMKRLNGVYTQRFNHAYGRVGHVFQGRYKSQTIGTEQHLFEACRYVVLNPVRAGLVNDPADWQWSSYRASAGLDAPLSCLDAAWVRERVAEHGDSQGYVQWISEGIGIPCHFLHLVDDSKPRTSQREAEHPLVPERSARLLPEILGGCTWVRSDSGELFARITEALDAGYSQRAIARELGVSNASISRFACRNTSRG